jgi:hypothetical protein
MIRVRFVRGDLYEVTVPGKNETVHRVTLRQFDRRRLAGENLSAEKLIEESFRFLLEREPNTSILTTFDLSVISRYFPEYERVIRERLRSLPQ